MHPWHDVDLGDRLERHFRVVIEIPKGSKIAVHVDDPEYARYEDIGPLPPHRVLELQRFFLDDKTLEHKTVSVDDLRGRADAEPVIRAAARLYRERIRPA